MFTSTSWKDARLLASALLSAAGILAASRAVASDADAARPPELKSISVSPLAFSAAPGATQRLTVIGRYKDGSMKVLRNSGETFVSSNTAVATVSSAGVVTIASGGIVGDSANIEVTNKATGISAPPARSTLATVTTPSPNSEFAARATAVDNALCTAISPFYWEIGDQNGLLTSDSVGTTSTGPIVATTLFSIASAAKMLYAAYVTQSRGAASNLSTSDIDFLHFTSGYTNMDDKNSFTSICPKTLVPDTVNKCLTLTNSAGASYSAQNPATVGAFDYNSGHMENHASRNTPLGPVPVTSLGSTVAAQLGNGITFNYTEPLTAGGVSTTAAMYAQVLRNILNGSLAFRDALGTNPVCTQTSVNCNAIYTPFPDEAWHYSIGHWVEDNPATNGDGAFSSGGTFGFYPWIDSTKSYYGIIAHNQPNAGYPTVECGRLIRRAFMTGIEQTGVIPTP